MFLDKSEIDLTNEYLDQGYVIRKVANQEALDWIQEQFIQITENSLSLSLAKKEPQEILNTIHEQVPVESLNQFRMRVIKEFNAIPNFREMYFRVAKPYLDVLVGNELAMQLRVNLSIQFPNDDSSLLPVHADTWSGDSPFEVVVWLPLVNCFGTKAMYLLPPQRAKELTSNFKSNAGKNSEDLYHSINEDIIWLEVEFGQVLIFDQSLPHGNRINMENETRWSMNCRFKGAFTPYGDKKLGEFFEPITLRAASKTGMNYKLPKL